jgi:PPOX class probable F420-dependent enzyme
MNTGKGRSLVLVITLLSAGGLLAGGLWALTAPESFARFANFPPHEHFEHDLGAFQIGVAVTLLLALVWSDALATALAGFGVLNTLHAVNHFTDLDLGGSGWQPWGLVLLSVAVAVALGVRIRQLGLVLGEVVGATTPQLAPFVRQKTILLTTFRRDGTPVGTPVSIAVDGDHAYVRSFEKAFKTRRVRANPEVEFAPSDARGRPTGPGWRGRLDPATGEQYRRAARLLARKYPLLHGVLVPFIHRAMRSRTGRTVHFVLTPAIPAAAPSAPR